MDKLVLALLLILANPVKAESGLASYYAHFHHGKKMANGKPFNMWARTVAHKRIKLGTWLKICHKQRCSTAQVTDRGPYIGKRKLDLSLEVATRLCTVKKGVAKVSFVKITKPEVSKMSEKAFMVVRELPHKTVKILAFAKDVDEASNKKQAYKKQETVLVLFGRDWLSVGDEVRKDELN